MQAQPYSLLGVQESIAQNTPTSAFIINRQSNKETKSVSIKQEMNEEDRPIVLSSRIVPLQLQTCKERETLPNTILTNLNVETYNKLTSRSKRPPKSRVKGSKKRPCNCSKSKCLKLYCECFAAGEFCLDCNCRNCHNNLEHESQRSFAIKASLERNPTAFKPKIGVTLKPGVSVDMERLHQKGCNCKRSNCLKNYCECYEAKVPCTERCKCRSCNNTEDQPHHSKDKYGSNVVRGLAQMAEVASADAVKAEYESRSKINESDASPNGHHFYSSGTADIFRGEFNEKSAPNPKTQPWYFLTDDVIEATATCLVVKAQEVEQTLSTTLSDARKTRGESSATNDEDLVTKQLEESIICEFGRCLQAILESARSCQKQQQIQLGLFDSPRNNTY